MNPDQRTQSKPRIEVEPAPVAESPPRILAESARPKPPTDGIPWVRWAAGSLVPLAGVAAGVVSLLASQKRARLALVRRQQLGGVVIAGTLLAAGFAVRAHLRDRAAEAPVDLEEDPPLFV